MIENPEKNSFNQAYRMAAFYSLDIAHIYDLLGDREKAQQYYRTTIEYLDCADFQPLWIRIECLNVLGKHKEALEAALDDSHYTKLGLAKLYEKAGKHDFAREIYTELAMEQSKKAIKSKFLSLLFLQHASDLWARAQNPEEARKYNERAIKAWKRMKDKMERPLHTIEEAWLFEEVGYIYELSLKSLLTKEDILVHIFWILLTAVCQDFKHSARTILGTNMVDSPFSTDLNTENFKENRSFRNRDEI